MLSLGRWSCRIPAGFLVSCCTQVPLLYSSSSSPTGHSPSSARSSIPVRLTLTFFTFAVLQPQIALVWAVALSLAATQAVTFCFPFLRVLRCFSSPGTFPVKQDDLIGRVPPFGYRRVFASLQLAAAFRSLARPSSVASGQAFSLRPSFLDQLSSLYNCVFRDIYLHELFKHYCLTSVLSSTCVLDLLLYHASLFKDLWESFSQNQTEYLFIYSLYT